MFVVPVTRGAPRSPDDAMEVPAAVSRRLGLDDARPWIVLTEMNEFTWPGPDLRTLPGRAADSIVLGFMPPRLFEAVRRRMRALARVGRAARIRRTE